MSTATMKTTIEIVANALEHIVDEVSLVFVRPLVGGLMNEIKFGSLRVQI